MGSRQCCVFAVGFDVRSAFQQTTFALLMRTHCLTQTIGPLKREASSFYFPVKSFKPDASFWREVCPLLGFVVHNRLRLVFDHRRCFDHLLESVQRRRLRERRSYRGAGELGLRRKCNRIAAWQCKTSEVLWLFQICVKSCERFCGELCLWRRAFH